MSKYVSLAAAAAVAIVLSVGASTAQAATTPMSADLPGNDCSGFFGTGFNNCNIFFEDENGNKTLLSPVIAKYGIVEDEDDPDFGEFKVLETNTSVFPSIDGGEFTVNHDTTDPEGGSGDWTYNPLGDDPAVKYWVVKQGNAFTLFWEVLTQALNDEPGVCDDPYNLACLQLAQPLLAGSWTGAFSHITWYDSTSTVIPLPAGFVLFLSGLAGVGFLGRYKAKRRELAIN